MVRMGSSRLQRLLYLMVLIDCHTISKSIDNDEKLDDIFDSITDIDHTRNPKQRRDRLIHKYRTNYKDEIGRPIEHREPRLYLVTEKKPQKKTTEKTTSEHTKHHKSPKKRVGSFWRKFRGKDKKNKQNDERKRRVPTKRGHQWRYPATRDFQNTSPRIKSRTKYRNHFTLRQQELNFEKRDIRNEVLFSSREHKPYFNKVQIGIAPQRETTTKMAPTPTRTLTPTRTPTPTPTPTPTVAPTPMPSWMPTPTYTPTSTRSQTKNLGKLGKLGDLDSEMDANNVQFNDATTENINTVIASMTTQLKHLKLIYGLNRVNPIKSGPYSFSPELQQTAYFRPHLAHTTFSISNTTTPTINNKMDEMPGTAQIEEILNDIKVKAIQKVAEQNPAITDIITNTTTESTFEADPIITHLDRAALGYNSFESVNDLKSYYGKRTVPPINGFYRNRKSVLYTEPHYLIARSIKEDTITMAHNMEDKLERELKNVYQKIKNKVSGDFRKEIHKAKTTIKETMDKISSKVTSKLNKPTTCKKIKCIEHKFSPPKVTSMIPPTTRSRHTRGQSKKSKTPAQVTSTAPPPTFDDYLMLTLYEQMLAKTHEESDIKMLSTVNLSNRRRRQNFRVSKRNPETLTDVKLKEDIETLYNDGIHMPAYDYMEPPYRELSSSSHNTSPSSSTDHIDTNEYTSQMEANPYMLPPNLTNVGTGIEKPSSLQGSSMIQPITSSSLDDTSYEGLSNKICYNDFVNGYKHYLKFQKEQGEQNFSNLVKYQAHRHHSVDDIGKYILDKIPQMPREKRFFDDSDIDDQEISTKSDDSWFKKHFYLFIESGPPKKFHTSQTVSLKSAVTEPYIKISIATDDNRIRPGPHDQVFIKIGSDEADQPYTTTKATTPNINNLNELNLDDLSKVLESIKYKQTTGMLSDELTTSLPPNLQKEMETTIGLNSTDNLISLRVIPHYFIGKWFGDKRRRTVKKNPYEEPPEYESATIDIFNDRIDYTGFRLKRTVTKYDVDNTVEYFMNKELQGTTPAKEVYSDLMARSNTKETNKFGYVDIDLVPRQTAVVKLRDNSSKRSRFKDFFKKFRLKKKKKKDKDKVDKKHVKREIIYPYRRVRFNPLKKLKDMFKVKNSDEKPIAIHNLIEPADRVTSPDYDMMTSHIDSYKPMKYNKPMTIDEMKKLIPNISEPLSLDDERTRQTTDKSTYTEVTFKLDDSDRDLLHYKNNMALSTLSPTSSTKYSTFREHKYPKHTFTPTIIPFTTITNKLPPSNVMTINLKTMKPTLSSMINFVKYTSDTPKKVSKTSTVPLNLMTLDDMNMILNKLQHKLSKSTKNFPKHSTIFVKRNTLDVTTRSLQPEENENEDSMEQLTIKTKLTRMAKFPISKRHFKNRHEEVPDETNDYSNFHEGPVFKELRHDIWNRNSVPEKKKINSNTKYVSSGPRSHSSNGKSYYTDYFNDLLMWHNDILNLDKVPSPIWKNILRNLQQDTGETYTTPNMVNLMQELNELNDVFGDKKSNALGYSSVRPQCNSTIQGNSNANYNTSTEEDTFNIFWQSSGSTAANSFKKYNNADRSSLVGALDMPTVRNMLKKNTAVAFRRLYQQSSSKPVSLKSHKKSLGGDAANNWHKEAVGRPTNKNYIQKASLSTRPVSYSKLTQAILTTIPRHSNKDSFKSLTRIKDGAIRQTYNEAEKLSDKDIGVIRSVAMDDQAVVTSDNLVIKGEAKYFQYNRPTMRREMSEIEPIDLLTTVHNLKKFARFPLSHTTSSKKKNTKSKADTTEKLQTNPKSEPAIVVDTTLLAYDDDVESITTGLEVKKLSRNSQKGSKASNKLMKASLLKTNKAPVQYYNTPLPMKANDFDKFLKDNKMDVESVTSPMLELPSYLDPWNLKHTKASTYTSESVESKNDLPNPMQMQMDMPPNYDMPEMRPYLDAKPDPKPDVKPELSLELKPDPNPNPLHKTKSDFKQSHPEESKKFIHPTHDFVKPKSQRKCPTTRTIPDVIKYSTRIKLKPRPLRIRSTPKRTKLLTDVDRPKRNDMNKLPVYLNARARYPHKTTPEYNYYNILKKKMKLFDKKSSGLNAFAERPSTSFTIDPRNKEVEITIINFDDIDKITTSIKGYDPYPVMPYNKKTETTPPIDEYPEKDETELTTTTKPPIRYNVVKDLPDLIHNELIYKDIFKEPATTSTTTETTVNTKTTEGFSISDTVTSTTTDTTTEAMISQPVSKFRCQFDLLNKLPHSNNLDLPKRVHISSHHYKYDIFYNDENKKAIGVAPKPTIVTIATPKMSIPASTKHQIRFTLKDQTIFRKTESRTESVKINDGTVKKCRKAREVKLVTISSNAQDAESKHFQANSSNVSTPSLSSLEAALPVSFVYDLKHLKPTTRRHRRKLFKISSILQDKLKMLIKNTSTTSTGSTNATTFDFPMPRKLRFNDRNPRLTNSTILCCANCSCSQSFQTFPIGTITVKEPTTTCPTSPTSTPPQLVREDLKHEGFLISYSSDPNTPPICESHKSSETFSETTTTDVHSTSITTIESSNPRTLKCKSMKNKTGKSYIECILPDECSEEEITTRKKKLKKAKHKVKQIPKDALYMEPEEDQNYYETGSMFTPSKESTNTDDDDDDDDDREKEEKAALRNNHKKNAVALHNDEKDDVEYLHSDKKRDLHSTQNTFTAKDVAALEVIVDLMKNTLSYEEKDIANIFNNFVQTQVTKPRDTGLISAIQSDTTNSIQVHIAIPFDFQNGKKRSLIDPVRVRKVFSAKMSTPVDLEYQVHSFEAIIKPTTAEPVFHNNNPYGLSPGMYLLVDKPKSGYALKPVKAKIDISNLKTRHAWSVESTMSLADSLPTETGVIETTSSFKNPGKVTLSKDFIAAVNKQLIELYENITKGTEQERSRRARNVWRSRKWRNDLNEASEKRFGEIYGLTAKQNKEESLLVSKTTPDIDYDPTDSVLFGYGEIEINPKQEKTDNKKKPCFEGVTVETKKKEYMKGCVENFIAKRRIDWEAVKRYFGHDRVCSCKCKANKAMCRACAASDAVIEELIFEFDNLGNFMKDHCTEIQTFFWMNPSGGQKLRDTVSRIDKSLNDYYKRVKGKCQGRTCKTFSTYIDKRQLVRTYEVPRADMVTYLINDLTALADDLNKTIAMQTCFNKKLKIEGEKFIRAINSCMERKQPVGKRNILTTQKKSLVKNVYSLDNINVNIICNPEMPATTFSYESTLPTSSTHNTSKVGDHIFDYEIDNNSTRIIEHKKRKGLKKLFPRKNRHPKIFTYFVSSPDLMAQKKRKTHNKRDLQNQVASTLISDGGGDFWINYLKSNTDEPRIARDSNGDISNIDFSGNDIIEKTIIEKSSSSGLSSTYMPVRSSVKRSIDLNLESTTPDYLTNNINELLHLFGNLQNVQALSLDANHSTTTFADLADLDFFRLNLTHSPNHKFDDIDLDTDALMDLRVNHSKMYQPSTHNNVAVYHTLQLKQQTHNNEAVCHTQQNMQQTTARTSSAPITSTAPMNSIKLAITPAVPTKTTPKSMKTYKLSSKITEVVKETHYADDSTQQLNPTMNISVSSVEETERITVDALDSPRKTISSTTTPRSRPFPAEESPAPRNLADSHYSASALKPVVQSNPDASSCPPGTCSSELDSPTPPGMNQYPPGMNPPEMNQSPPGMNPPKMNQYPPEMNQPEMYQPEMTTPEMNSPGMNPVGTNPPRMNPPGMNQPGMNPPEMNPPGMNPPGMNPPGMNPPETNTPRMGSSNMNSSHLKDVGNHFTQTIHQYQTKQTTKSCLGAEVKKPSNVSTSTVKNSPLSAAIVSKSKTKTSKMTKTTKVTSKPTQKDIKTTFKLPTKPSRGKPSRGFLAKMKTATFNFLENVKVAGVDILEMSNVTTTESVNHKTSAATEEEHISASHIIDRISETEMDNFIELETTPMSSTHMSPTIVIINEYDEMSNDIMNDSVRNSEGYKNLLLSIIQYETNKLNDEWHKIAYGNEKDDTDMKRSVVSVMGSKAKSTKVPKSKGKGKSSDSYDIVKDVKNLEISEPILVSKKPEGLLNKIASKIGMKVSASKKKAIKKTKSREATKSKKRFKGRKTKSSDKTKNKPGTLGLEEACDTRRSTNQRQICDIQATYEHILALQKTVPSEIFENLVRNISCHKYRKAESFFIPYKSPGKKWDWIRNKRSLKYHLSRIDNLDEFEDGVGYVNFKDDNDFFEKYAKGGDGIYKIVERKKRTVNLNSLNSGLRNIPPLMPAENELFAMVGDSVTFDCHPTSVRPAEQYSWRADRTSMLNYDNVEINGVKIHIKNISPKNIGSYTCTQDNTIQRNIRVVVMTIPSFDVVFLPVYRIQKSCSYDDLRAIQYLGERMAQVAGCGNTCSIRIDEPVCQRDRGTNRSLIRSTAVISMQPREVNCSVQCRRDLISSIVMLCAANTPSLSDVGVVLSNDGVNQTLRPCRDIIRPVITHSLRKKDSNGHHEYHKLISSLSPGKVDVVLMCPAGYYLIQQHNICASCPANTSASPGDNTCSPCPHGTTSEPGAAKCLMSTSQRRYDWWWYPPCGYLAAFCGLICGCGLCVVLALIVHMATREDYTNEPMKFKVDKQEIRKPSTNVTAAFAHTTRARPLSPSRVILARFFKPSLTSSRATDSQETKFELWKERNLPPPLPPIDFDF